MFASGELFALTAAVAFVLAVLVGAGIWAARVGEVLEPRLSGDVTVVVWGRGLESADAATARAAEILSAQPGVTASALEPDVSDPLIGKLIGGGGPGNDGLRLIAVKTTSLNISPPSLIDRLHAEGIEAAADEHRKARGPLEHRIVLSALIVAGGVLVACAVLLAGSLLCGRAMVARREMRIALMFRLGASRRSLTSLVWRRAAVTGITSTLVGAGIGAMATATALRMKTVGADIPARPTFVDGAVVLACTLALVLITATGAAFGAGQALGRVERNN